MFGHNFKLGSPRQIIFFLHLHTCYNHYKYLSVKPALRIQCVHEILVYHG